MAKRVFFVIYYKGQHLTTRCWFLLDYSWCNIIYIIYYISHILYIMPELGLKVNPNITLITTYNTFYLKKTNYPGSLGTQWLRCSCNDKIKTSERTLLKICNNHNLRNGSGQTSGNRFGYYTCFNYERASVVDYLTVEKSLSMRKFLTSRVYTFPNIWLKTLTNCCYSQMSPNWKRKIAQSTKNLSLGTYHCSSKF